jgi:predicted RNA-binding Zn-ribbon protein involved in translation (DUF1610 family)
MIVTVGDSFWGEVPGYGTRELASWFRRRIEVAIRAHDPGLLADDVITAMVDWYSEQQHSFLAIEEADSFKWDGLDDNPVVWVLIKERVIEAIPVARDAAVTLGIRSIDDYLRLLDHGNPPTPAVEPYGARLLANAGNSAGVERLRNHADRASVSWPRLCGSCGQEFRPENRCASVNCADCRAKTIRKRSNRKGSNGESV